MSSALGLFRLQQVDRRIDQVETRLSAIRETLDNDIELRSSLARVEAAQEEQRVSERDRRKSEADAQSQNIKIQQLESSLYGGKVRNPKELQELETDITSLKKHLAILEENELNEMLKVEAAEASVATAQAELKQIQERLSLEHRKLIEEQESLTRDAESLSSERHALVTAIAAGMLSSYESLRQQRRGVAVAEVLDNSCGACGTTLTPAVQQNARHALQLVYCPSCGRILFAG
jgi:predicted  nucleic acid-binding Zn-ribbon protein